MQTLTTNSKTQPTTYEHILHGKIRRCIIGYFFCPPAEELNYSSLGRTFGNYTGRNLRRKDVRLWPLDDFCFCFPLFSRYYLADTYSEVCFWWRRSVYVNECWETKEKTLGLVLLCLTIPCIKWQKLKCDSSDNYLFYFFGLQTKGKNNF